MYVVQVATEITPVSKVGGLADVVYGLSRELERQGHNVEVILPKYDVMRYDQIHDLKPVYNDLWVPWYGGAVHCTVLSGLVYGVNCLFIDAHSSDSFFSRGSFYGHGDETLRWAFFCKAALEFMLKSNRRPDVIHCHDWQTGLLPVLLFEQYAHHGMGNQRVCYTIHNFKHQGPGPEAMLHATGLGRPNYFYSHERLRDHVKATDLNCMKGGVVYSNFVTTVSPHHAWEARFSPFGFGLGPTLDHHHNKFGGVLNGLDCDQYSPTNDQAIAQNYDVSKVDVTKKEEVENLFNLKNKNKDDLRNKLMLRKEGNKPIFGFVGRLDEQKGIDLIKHGIFWAIQNNAQFVVVGPPANSKINDEFWNLKHQLNNNPDCHIEIGFSDTLARQIYAGCDFLVVPSVFEPCGLTQMIALRYGTPPIVRYTGGLADTVFDWDFDQRPREERNGFVFHQGDQAALEGAMSRANGLYYSPEYYRQLALQGMKQDFSWREPAKHYVNIYEHIRHK